MFFCLEISAAFSVCSHTKWDSLFVSVKDPNVYVVIMTVDGCLIFNRLHKANTHNKHSTHTDATSQSKRCRQTVTNVWLMPRSPDLGSLTILTGCGRMLPHSCPCSDVYLHIEPGERVLWRTRHEHSHRVNLIYALV